MQDRSRRALRLCLQLAAAYALLLPLLARSPSALPRAAAPLIGPLVRMVDAEYIVQDVRFDDRSIIVRAECRKFARITNHQGARGASFPLECYHYLQALLVYPALVFTLLVAWPLSIPRKLLMLPVALGLVLLVVAWDTAIMVMWTGAETCALWARQLSGAIPATSENLEAFAALQRGFDRLALVKSFLSTGGRQFLGVAAFLAALGALSLVRARGGHAP